MLIELLEQLLELLLSLEDVRLLAVVAVSLVAIVYFIEGRSCFAYLPTETVKGFLLDATSPFDYIHLLRELLFIEEGNFIRWRLFVKLGEVSDRISLLWPLIGMSRSPDMWSPRNQVKLTEDMMAPVGCCRTY